MYSNNSKIGLGLKKRIYIIFSLIFTIILSIITFIIYLALNAQQNSIITEKYNTKINEINQYLNRIYDYTERFNEKKIKLNFEPEIENQRIVYPKPFNTDLDNFEYILYIENNKNDKNIIALNTTNIDLNSDFIKKYIDSYIPKNNLFLQKLKINNNYYAISKVTKHIKGNDFNVYILKSVNQQVYNNNFIIIIFILSLTAGLILIFLTANKITQNILKPLNSIINTAKEISKGDYKNRIEGVDDKSELYELVNMLNQMLEKIMNVFDKQSRFISDVSHELRTPISIIKGNAELIKRRYIALLTNEEKKEVKNDLLIECDDNIISECINMKNLIDSLLFLSKDEEFNQKNLNIKTINTKELLIKLVTDYKIVLGEERVVIENNDNFFFKADLDLTLQSLRILIDNSLKYSSKKVYLSSNINYQEKKGLISVRDEGSGIKEEYLENIFDRFYRIDESRNKNTGGHGLGLSIFKQILNIQTQEFDIESKLNVGTKITIKINEINNHEV